jgi:LPXTG-motif cell wall-anchored protein
MSKHVSGRRRVAAGLATVAVGAIGLVGAFPSAAGASSSTGGDDLPFEHPCPDGGWYFHWGPHNQDSIPGTHDQDDGALESGGEGEFSVEISEIRVEEGRSTFDFTTSVPVNLVFAMGYPNTDTEGTTQDYEPAVSEGTIGVDDPQYVKHVVFCEAPETPPSTEPTTTTTEATTTTTEAPTTTSTVPPSTEPTTPTTAPPSSEAPTTAPPTTEPISDDELPRTGNNTMPMVAGAGALLAVGVALVAGKRYMQQRA